MLPQIPQIKPMHYFYLANGQVIKKLEELPDVILKLDNSVFFNHVTPYKNDFAKWIYDVFKLNELAEIVGKEKSKEEIARIIKAYLKKYNLNSEILSNTMVNNQSTRENIGYGVSSNIDVGSTNAHPSNASQNNSNISNISTSQSQSSFNKTEIKPVDSTHEYKDKKETTLKDELSAKSSTQQKKIYVWKTSLVSEVKFKQKNREEKKEEKKEEQKKEEKKEEEIKNLQKEENILKKEDGIKKEQSQKIEELNSDKRIDGEKDISKLNNASDILPDSPDEFFLKNPVIIEHVVEAKKRALELEKLDMINISGDEDPKQLAELFKETYSKAYQRLCFLRKNGFDTSLAELMLFRIPPKIKLFEASHEQKDAVAVKRFINEAIEELNSVK